MLLKLFGWKLTLRRCTPVRVVLDGQSFPVHASLALAVVAERRAAAEALAGERAEVARARADAERERDRADQAEAAAALAQELLANERGARREALTALLARVRPEIATAGKSEAEILAVLEVACEAAAKDGALLRACAPWGQA